MAYKWKNRGKQRRKQYIFHSKWLSRIFTGSFCLSTTPDIFPIVSLHCHAVFDRESWLGEMYFKQGHFRGPRMDDQTGSGISNSIDNWIQLFQSAVSEGKLRPTDELLVPDYSSNPISQVHMSLLDVRFPTLQQNIIVFHPNETRFLFATGSKLLRLIHFRHSANISFVC